MLPRQRGSAPLHSDMFFNKLLHKYKSKTDKWVDQGGMKSVAFLLSTEKSYANDFALRCNYMETLHDVEIIRVFKALLNLSHPAFLQIPVVSNEGNGF